MILTPILFILGLMSREIYSDYYFLTVRYRRSMFARQNGNASSRSHLNSIVIAVISWSRELSICMLLSKSAERSMRSTIEFSVKNL